MGTGEVFFFCCIFAKTRGQAGFSFCRPRPEQTGVFRHEVEKEKRKQTSFPDGTLQIAGRFANSSAHCAIVHACIIEEADRRTQERKMAILVAEKIFQKSVDTWVGRR